jgi:hypothetical protein
MRSCIEAELDFGFGRFDACKRGESSRVSLRGRTIEERAVLSEGGEVVIRVGVADDPYIAKKELDTVTVELERDGEHIAAVNTVLDVDQESEAVALAREIRAGLESGELEPTAGAIEPLANRVPST